MDAVATSARSLFPKSAGRISVTYAWRRADSTLDAPSGYGSDGWSPVQRIASNAVLTELRDDGYTHVALQPSRAGSARSPVRIDTLIH